MTAGDGTEEQSYRLRLPATSANLGPGFDALGLALSLYLELEAQPAAAFALEATGRDAAVTGALDDNLMLATYRSVLKAHGRDLQPLAISIHNEIPLGMGCGSSAAALCAGVLLANRFGALGLSEAEVLEEAARREGHPDNVAACLYGGLTVSKSCVEGERRWTATATLGRGLDWRLLLALPSATLATAAARALLPAVYSREDATVNLQSTALLVSAVALDRPELLRAATEDRLHQPYRLRACPLLGALLPLAGRKGVFSVTLSGAGPSVLLIVDRDFDEAAVRRAAGSLVEELLTVMVDANGAFAAIPGRRAE